MPSRASKFKNKITAAALLFLIAVLPLVGCGANEPKRSTTFAMDTVVSFTCYGQNADACIAACHDRLFELAADLDIHQSGSISALNKANGQWTPISEPAFRLLELALEYAALTDGAFDPTVGSILLAWDDFSGKVVPSAEQRQAAAELTNYTQLELNLKDRSAKIKQGQAVALGAVAKGFVGNELAKIYRSFDCSGIIDLGGNICTVGKKPNGDNFKIGIRSPFDQNGIIKTLSLADCCVVTSGAYERNFTLNGTTYHHIFDPSSGSPAVSDLASVSVIASDGALCDALSTALFVMGSQKSLDFIKNIEGVSLVLVLNDGSIIEAGQ